MTDGELTKDEFATRKSLLFDEQARVKSLLNDAEQSAQHWIERAEEFFNTTLHAKEMIENGTSEDRGKLLKTIGERRKNLMTYYSKMSIVLTGSEQ